MRLISERVWRELDFENHTAAELAKRLGCTPNWVYRQARRRGKTTKPQPRGFKSPMEWNTIAWDSTSAAEVARQTGYSRQWCTVMRNRHLSKSGK